MGINWGGETVFTLDHRLDAALQEIRKFDNVKARYKGKTLLKFGATDSLGTSQETIWDSGGTETLPTTNAIDTLSSSSTSDTMAIKVEGHTIDANNNFHFVVQSATLLGRNKVLLGTPLARASRMYNDSGSDFNGEVYVYEDDTLTDGVPNTSTKIHLKNSVGVNNSLKCATTISNEDYYIITQFYAAVNKKTTATVDFKLEIKRKGKVFRDVFKSTANSSSNTSPFNLDPAIIVPPNSDVRVTGIGSTTSVGASAWFNGHLALVINN